MRTLISYRFLVFVFFLPFALCASGENLEEEPDHSIADEMLIKPSVIDIGADLQAADSKFLESNVKEPEAEGSQLDFLGNLQANLGSISMPMATQQADGSPANTWVPKFVWIGDVKQSDDLKCFAAFLIGSLADKNNTTAQASPGVFMTPVTTPAASAPQVTQTVSSTVPRRTMTARSSRSAPPPPMPARSKFFTEFDAGLSFLYFAGVKGNLITIPENIFLPPTGQSGGVGFTQSQPIRGRIETNRTPLYTLDFGWHLMNSVDFGCTIQAQQGIAIRTKPFQFAYIAAGVPTLVINNFEANLDLYSIGGKLMFHWNEMLRYSGWTMDLFFGGSVAGAWQSWTKVQAVQSFFNNAVGVLDSMQNSNVSFRNQYYTNFSYTGDAGFLFKPSNIFSKTAFRMGCKFVGWGSTRGLGDQKDQGDIFNDGSTANDPTLTSFNGRIRPGYFKPIRIKTIYAWVPYIGIVFDF